MISYEEAMARVLEAATAMPAEVLPLERAAGRVLAEAIVAPWPMPRFDQSAVDGYAVRTQDITSCSTANPVKLPLAHTHRAGDATSLALAPFTAIKIFTGAPLPMGADAVIMREAVEEQPDHIQVTRPEAAGANIRYAGEEYVQGAKILASGIVITPPVQALLASINHGSVSVYTRPQIALVITGDELLDPSEALAAGKIYDANGWGLVAALQGLGLGGVELYRVKDTANDLRQILRQAMRNADLVISTGGVSMGDYDLVRSTAMELGIEEVFWQVAVKPGKPLMFGRWAGPEEDDRPRLFFGLPGNPVAVLVLFHQIVRPALLKMMGCSEISDAAMTAKVLCPLRKKAGRLEWVRAKLDRARMSVQPATGQGSHMLGGLAQADCLIEFPTEVTRLESGEIVRVIPLRWSLL